VIDFDANFLIDFLANDPRVQRPVEQWLSEGQTISISAVAWAEVLCGPLGDYDLDRARALITEIEPLLAQDAVSAAELFNSAGRRPRSLADCMIAAIALRRRAALATTNAADFGRFKRFGLILAQ
jgi:predicted nucleic acid-binding protein